MRPFTCTARFTRLTIALVVMAMLCAQWVGLAHSIAHGGLQQASPYFSAHVTTPETGGKYATHSCVLFDAAAIGAALDTPPVSLALLPGLPVLALWLAFASWNAPFLRHFSSRAPPCA